MNHEQPAYRYKQNRFQQLRGFCYAAQVGSISLAAKRMGLSQPAVSQQIQSLERELAVPLFVRHGSKIRLTHEGELLLEMAHPLIDQLERLDQQFHQRRTEADAGYVEVAAGGSTILYVLPKYVEAFCRSYPRIELRLHNVTGLEGLARLRAGLVDFAVGPMDEVPADIDFFPVIAYEPVIITCRSHPLTRRRQPLTLQELSRHPLILPPRHLSTWNMVDSTFKKQGLNYQVAMEVGGWELIKKYVELGLGVSIISSIGITGKEKLHIIPAGKFFPKRTYGVVLRRGRILTTQARRFVDLMLNWKEPENTANQETPPSAMPEEQPISD